MGNLHSNDDQKGDRTSTYMQLKLTYAIAHGQLALPALGVLAPDMGILQPMLVFEF